MKAQLLQAWQTHNDKNLLLLRSLPEEALDFTLLSKGRSIGDQLAHLHNVRITWTEHVAKKLYQKDLLFQKGLKPDAPDLSQALTASAAIITQVIEQSWENEGRLPSYKAGLIPFIAYLISHESHHRGNILLTLKQSGLKLPDQLKWGLWEWSR